MKTKKNTGWNLHSSLHVFARLPGGQQKRAPIASKTSPLWEMCDICLLQHIPPRAHWLARSALIRFPRGVFILRRIIFSMHSLHMCSAACRPTGTTVAWWSPPPPHPTVWKHRLQAQSWLHRHRHRKCALLSLSGQKSSVEKSCAAKPRPKHKH